MEDQIDLQQVERKALSTIHQDGLLDLGLGLGLLLVGLTLMRGGSTFLALLPILLAMFVRGMRRRYTYPRVGFAKFKSPGLNKVMVIELVGITLLLGILAAMVIPRSVIPIKISASDQWLTFSYFTAFIILVIGMIFAYSQKYHRIYSYALLMIGCYLHSRLTPVPLPLYLLMIGIVATIVGLTMFFKFLKSHPIASAG
jgi:hypothetical protein